MRKHDKSHLKFLPIALNITDKKILIVGGGKVALQKVQSVSQYTDALTLLAPQFIDELKLLSFPKITKNYVDTDLFGFDIVYACTNDENTNACIHEDANRNGVLINVVDNPLLCDFVSPALIKHNNISIAVSSNAQDVNRAVEVRNIIRNFAEKALFAVENNPAKTGTVYLVGFGPGDPDLLTIKAFKLLQQADIIFYDDLTNATEFLDSFSADKVYVGKRKLKHSVIQAGINILLFEAANSGKTVVRLKGGDPMIFAHGGEEIDYLQQRNIDVEVVPGISSALAAAAAAQVPLTHRGISSSVTFATGHPEKNFYIPASGTMVIYMGASNLKSLVRKVIEQGWSEQTPIMLIQNVSLPNQKKQLSTLKHVFEGIVDYPSPLLVIIGEVMNRKSVI